MFYPPSRHRTVVSAKAAATYMDEYLCTIDKAPSTGNSRGVPSVVYTYYLRHTPSTQRITKGSPTQNVPGPSPWVEGSREKSKWRRAGKREQREWQRGMLNGREPPRMVGDPSLSRYYLSPNVAWGMADALQRAAREGSRWLSIDGEQMVDLRALIGVATRCCISRWWCP